MHHPDQKSLNAQSVDIYQRDRAKYESFTKKLVALLHDLFSAEGIHPQLLESRTKSVESFAEKIGREGKGYVNPLNEVTDFCGLRIVAYTIDDVAAIGRLINEEFEIDQEHSGDKRQSLKPHEFGYLSVHYIARLDQQRATLREFRNFEGMRFEIQLRTVLQHAWAAIDHRLRYKSATDAPEHIRRRLFLVSGMLELADRELAAVVADALRHARQVEVDLNNEQLDLDVDLESALGYLGISAHLDQIIEKALAAGLSDMNLRNENRPHLEFVRREYASELVQSCGLAGIRSIRELDDVLGAFVARASTYFEIIAYEYSGFAPLRATIAAIAIWAVCRDKFTVDDLERLGWDRELAELFLESSNRSPPTGRSN